MHFLRKLDFSRRRGYVLDNVVVDEHGPGTVLHDFEAFLAYVEEHDVRLTDMYQLRRHMLPEINARLTIPLRHGLTHPLQQSYPHIHGLYLLLRASGLTIVEQAAAGPLLIIDEQVHGSWETLNATERYCTLLETWLLRGNPEIIGEGARPSYDPLDEFDKCLRFFLRIPEDGLQVGGEDGSERLLRQRPGRHHLGLLELFGLIRIESGPPEQGKGWRITRVERTELGEALLARLHSEFQTRPADYNLPRKGAMIPFGVLQAALQPSFPEWKQSLTIPGWTFRDGTHRFEVTLGPESYRTKALACQSLDHLASAIVDAFKFDPDHFYCFSYRDRFGVERHIYHPSLEEEPQTDETMVGDVPLHIGQSMIFLFDCGKCWKLQVTLECVDADL